MTDPVIVKERAGGKYTQDVNTPRHHFYADEPASYGSADIGPCLLYTSPSPRDQRGSRMPSSA